jgi:hypothetical protein
MTSLFSTPGPRVGRAGTWPWLGLAAGLLQLLLLLRSYRTLLLHPGQYLIVDHYDGSKSYFSLATFLRQPLSQGLLEHGQNYPFGEYIFFTDIAPILSVPLHALVQAVPALAPYGLYLFDVFFLGGVVISTLLLVSILRRLAVPAWLALVLSLALPWISPQTFRLNVGHLALSYTPAMLLPLWVLQGLYRAGRAGQPTGRWWVGLGLAVIAAAWVHFYYLGILVGWMLLFLGCWGLREAQASRPWRPLAVRAAAWLSVVALSTFGLLQVLDRRSGERPLGSGGYDWIEWKFQLGSLFKGGDYHKIRFLLERTAGVPYESTAYLGAFVLYGLVVVVLLLWVSRQRRRQGLATAGLLPVLPPSDTDTNREFLHLLLLASLPLLLAALGETIELDNGAYIIHNYLNPFLWVHKLTVRITQFRALGRFIWPFWWAVVLGFSWYAGLAWRQAQGWVRGLWVVLAGVAVVDMLNAAHHYEKVTQRANFLGATGTAEVQALVGPLAPGRYQALLNLPFYHSGTDGTDASEPLFMGIDPDDPLCNRSYQLGMATGLPLMAHKAARTPAYQARELMSMFRVGGPDAALLARLDRRPILVYLDSAYFSGTNNFYRDQLRDRPEVLALYERMPVFIQEQHMRRLRHAGTVSLYEWQPKL